MFTLLRGSTVRRVTLNAPGCSRMRHDLRDREIPSYIQSPFVYFVFWLMSLRSETWLNLQSFSVSSVGFVGNFRSSPY